MSTVLDRTLTGRTDATQSPGIATSDAPRLLLSDEARCSPQRLWNGPVVSTLTRLTRASESARTGWVRSSRASFDGATSAAVRAILDEVDLMARPFRVHVSVQETSTRAYMPLA